MGCSQVLIHLQGAFNAAPVEAGVGFLTLKKEEKMKMYE